MDKLDTDMPVKLMAEIMLTTYKKAEEQGEGLKFFTFVADKMIEDGVRMVAAERVLAKTRKRMSASWGLLIGVVVYLGYVGVLWT